MFDPKPNRYPYPKKTDEHYLIVKKNNGAVFDKDYPYVDKSKGFRFRQTLVRLLLYLVVWPALHVRLGFRIEGKQNLKKNRELLRKGAVSCCNHVHMWDYLGIMRAIRPTRPNILAWAPNLRGENAKLIRIVGGIPIPENDLPATFAYLRAIRDLLEEGGWLHVYSEGSMWEYYQPIRPFKKGAAYFACRHNKPLIPLAYSYRKPSWWRKKLFKQYATFTLHIGEPLFADPNLEKTAQVDDLTRRSHEAVCRLAGIDPKENPYGPIFADDERVDYYTDEYGIGYKGSW